MKFHSTFLATATAIALGVPTANAIVYEFTPADNAEIDQLKTIVVYTADEEDMIAYRSKPVIKINGQDVSTTANTSGEYFDVLTFTLDQAYTTPGTCTVTIPPRTFYYGLYETNNAEITLHYNIKGTSQGGDDPTPGKPFDNPGATINPQQGSVTSLHSFEISYSGYGLLDTNNSKRATLTNDATGATVAQGKGTDGTGMTSMIVTLDTEITEPGTYTLTVPEGLFYDMYTDDDVPQSQWRYTIGGDVPPPAEDPEEVTATPADEACVEQLQTIVVTFTDAQGNVVYPRDNASYTVTDASGATVATGTPERVTLQADALALNLTEPITAEGTYTVTIPKNCILLGEDPDYQRMNRTVKLTYTVKPFEIPPVFENDGVTIDPEQGNATYLESFNIKVTKVQFADINYTKEISLIDLRTGSTVATGKASYGAFISDVVIDLDKAVTEAGAYKLHLPEGALYDAVTDDDLPEMNFLYVLDGSGTKPEVTPDNVIATPEAGEISGPWKQVTLTYLDVPSVYKHDNANVRVTDADGQEVTTATMILGEYANEMDFVFRNEINTTGIYVFEVPARAMILGEMKDSYFSQEVKLTYSLTQSGLELIKAETQGQPVYNLHGIKVSDCGTAGLPAGIYVTGGQKVVVK